MADRNNLQAILKLLKLLVARPQQAPTINLHMGAQRPPMARPPVPPSGLRNTAKPEGVVPRVSPS